MKKQIAQIKIICTLNKKPICKTYAGSRKEKEKKVNSCIGNCSVLYWFTYSNILCLFLGLQISLFHTVNWTLENAHLQEEPDYRRPSLTLVDQIIQSAITHHRTRRELGPATMGLEKVGLASPTCLLLWQKWHAWVLSS